MKGIVQLVGDFGNPAGTGVAKLVVDDLQSADAETALVDMDTFADNLKADGFTAANVGDVGITVKTIQFADKPGAGVNVDRQLISHYRTKSDDTVRRLTVSGIADGAPVLEDADAGERLTDAAKVTLAEHFDTLMGWTDETVVLYGKVLQKA